MGCEGVFEQITEEALQCWNLDHILDAELPGKKKPEKCTFKDMINEEHGNPLSNDDTVIVD